MSYTTEERESLMVEILKFFDEKEILFGEGDLMLCEILASLASLYNNPPRVIKKMQEAINAAYESIKEKSDESESDSIRKT